MKLNQKIPLVDLAILNALVRDYLLVPKKLAQLYSFEANLTGIEAAMKAKNGFGNRALLHQSLQKQYTNFNISKATQDNLDLIKEANTFTVCTAHQLCLFTGPSYFIYKILSAIKLSKELKVNYPSNNFVPVYWMGSEDHDFEEINHAFVYGKKITWENAEEGAAGNRSLKGIPEVIGTLSELLGDSENAKVLVENLKAHFSGDKTYGQAFQSWVLDLFSAYGLLVLDQNDVQLKRVFSSVMQDEVLNGSAEKALAKNGKFLSKHYHNQASSRPINLFYLSANLRDRIELSGETYKVLNSHLSFSKETMLLELKNHPERFSPNVILRPLYQETVLPNVAFIGGPGEVAYWLQLKEVFKHFKISPPAILLRDMAVILPKNQLERIDSWGISVKDLFSHYDQIAKHIVENESEHELSLATEKKAINELFVSIKNKALAIDKNMGRSVEAEQQKIFNALENLESKLLRSEKKNFEQKLNQLESIQQKLLPNDTLQERHDNFIPNYLKETNSYFQSILETLDVFEHQLKVFEA